MPQYRRYYQRGSCIFLTLCTHQKRSIFHTPENIHKLRLALAQTKSEMPFEIIAAVILPDHIHFLWQLPENEWDYSKRVGRMKALFSKSMGDVGYEPDYLSLSKKKHREKAVWQRRFWESTVKDERQFAAYVDYIHFNPVKHGYTACPHQWEFSSFHRWVRDGQLNRDWCCCCTGGDRPQ